MIYDFLEGWIAHSMHANTYKLRKKNPLREIFGKVKFKIPTDELLKKVDEDLNPD